MVIDVFAGAGGWDLAARALGLEPLGIEWDEAACATRDAAGLRTLRADVAALDPEELVPAGGHVVGLIGGPPCQAFSAAGSGEGRKATRALLNAIAALGSPGEWTREALHAACSDERAHLVLEPLRWAIALRPRWVALEQVEPVLPLWEAIATRLRALGYSAWTGVLSAERYGVPQTRRRAILLASLDRPVGEPAATHRRYVTPRRNGAQEETLFAPPEPERIQLAEEAHLEPWVSMAEALGWGMTARPYPVIASSRSTGGPDKEKVGGSGARETIYAEQEAGRWVVRTSFGEPGDSGGGVLEPFDPAARPARTLTEKTRSWKVLETGTRVNSTARAAGEPAPTLAFGNDVASHRWEGDAEPVRLRIEEAALLQSFPAGYPWQGTRTKQFEQVGNAIPPLLALRALEVVAR